MAKRDRADTLYAASPKYPCGYGIAANGARAASRDERAALRAAAGAKPLATWARETLLRAAWRKA